MTSRTKHINDIFCFSKGPLAPESEKKTETDLYVFVKYLGVEV